MTDAREQGVGHAAPAAGTAVPAGLDAARPDGCADRLISRTLSYAIVTGLLVGLYAGPVLLATEVLSITSPVAVAASTLAAAALFSPLRRRVQRAVDRRFNRVRYDADQTIAAFAARLQEGAALGAVRSDLLTVVNTAVEPAHISVWIGPYNPGG